MAAILSSVHKALHKVCNLPGLTVFTLCNTKYDHFKARDTLSCPLVLHTLSSSKSKKKCWHVAIH